MDGLSLVRVPSQGKRGNRLTKKTEVENKTKVVSGFRVGFLLANGEDETFCCCPWYNMYLPRPI